MGNYREEPFFDGGQDKLARRQKLEIERRKKNKDKKRLEAEERNRLYKIKNVWKKELTAVEEKIELLSRIKS